MWRNIYEDYSKIQRLLQKESDPKNLEFRYHCQDSVVKLKFHKFYFQTKNNFKLSIKCSEKSDLNVWAWLLGEGCGVELWIWESSTEMLFINSEWHHEEVNADRKDGPSEVWAPGLGPVHHRGKGRTSKADGEGQSEGSEGTGACGTWWHPPPATHTHTHTWKGRETAYYPERGFCGEQSSFPNWSQMAAETRERRMA